MPAYCTICSSGVTPSTPHLKCSVCNKYYHIKCYTEDVPDAYSDASWVCKACSLSNALSTPITLSAIENIIEKQFLKFKSDIMIEMSQIIDSKLVLVNNRMSEIENNMHRLQTEINEIRESAPNNEATNNIDDVAREICDRNERSKNVILYNIPESVANSVEVKVMDDLKQVVSIVEPLGKFPKPKKIFRLGIPKPNAPRPLKMVFEDCEEAQLYLRSNKTNPNKKFHFRADLTRLQRAKNYAVIEEINLRKSRGESDLRLIYNNNVAQITRANKGRRSQHLN